jgi:retron-type reverse transcriptase
MRVYAAWRGFRRGKRATGEIDEFEYYLERNLTELAGEISGRTWRHGGYRRVVVEEKKRRDLAVATVRDRIVHRLVYDELVLLFDRGFDFDVWSCRKGKGLSGCILRVQEFCRRFPEAYVWRGDVRKFFDNVGHERLMECLGRRVGGDLLWLCREIVRSYGCGGGGGGG